MTEELLKDAGSPPPTGGSRTRRLFIWGIAIFVFLALQVDVRLTHSRRLYGPAIDASRFVSWSLQAARESRIGIESVIAHPSFLAAKAPTVINKISVPIAREGHRIFTILATLPLTVWFKMVGASLTKGQALASCLGFVSLCALIAAALAGLKTPLHRKLAIAIALLALVGFNPLFLTYTATPTWHGFAFFWLSVIWWFARRDWRSESWSRGQALAIWFAFAFLLYSIYFFPLLLVGIWAVCDWFARSSRSHRRTIILYWGSLGTLALPGLLLNLARPGAALHWGSYWFVPHLGRILTASTWMVLGTSLLLPCLLIYAFRRSRQHLPQILFTIVTAGMVIFVMNGSNVARLALYLLPGAVLAAARFGQTRWGHALLWVGAITITAASLGWPDATFAALFPRGENLPQESVRGEAIAGLIKQAKPDASTPLAFRYKDDADLALARLDAPPEGGVILNAGRFLEVATTDREPSFLRRSYPDVTGLPDHVLLVTEDNEASALLEAAEPHFDVRLVSRQETAPLRFAPRESLSAYLLTRRSP